MAGREGNRWRAAARSGAPSNGWLLLLLLACLLPLMRLDGGTTTVALRQTSLEEARAAVEPEPFPRGPERMLQDQELVYGPGAARFDIAAFLAERPELASDPAGSALALAGVARRHSIDPRPLLTLLALGELPPGASLADRAARAAVGLAEGYYGLKHRRDSTMVFADGSRQPGPLEGGAAHFALARYLAGLGSAASLPQRQARFAETHAALFGAARTLPPPLPTGLEQPPLLLPWAEGQRWHYTGGPHGAWGVASAWGAVDFAPPSLVGCAAAPERVLAAAPGRVTFSEEGLVLVDLDDDGDEGTGWVLAYLHMAGAGRAEPGSWLRAGDPVGHPSCEGGVADGAHLHLARRHNGEWLPAAGGPAPLELSGWRFQSLGGEYDGSMQHPEQGTRMAVTSRRGGETGVVSDNGPTRRAELAAAWRSLLDPERAALARRPPPEGEAPTPAPVSGVAAAPAASGGAPTQGSLVLRLALEGRESFATPVVIGLGRPGERPVVLMGRSDARGTVGPVLLPEGLRGRYDLVLRAPGFAPVHALGLELGEGRVELDLSAGGRSRLSPGELNGDDRIDRRDITAWLEHRRAGRELADLDGDGRAAVGDLWRLLLSIAER